MGSVGGRCDQSHYIGKDLLMFSVLVSGVCGESGEGGQSHYIGKDLLVFSVLVSGVCGESGEGGQSHYIGKDLLMFFSTCVQCGWSVSSSDTS